MVPMTTFSKNVSKPPCRGNAAWPFVSRKGDNKMKRKNLCLQAVTDELRQAGIDFQIEHGSKHLLVRFAVHGRPMMCTVSVSTSNWNAHLNARGNVHRLLRQVAGEQQL